jgi:hypothetical protein
MTRNTRVYGGGRFFTEWADAIGRVKCEGLSEHSYMIMKEVRESGAFVIT